MNWAALRNNKCPKCGGAVYGVNGYIACARAHDCGFKITEERMSEIVTQRNATLLERLGEPTDRPLHGPESSCPVDFCERCKEVGERIEDLN